MSWKSKLSHVLIGFFSYNEAKLDARKKIVATIFSKQTNPGVNPINGLQTCNYKLGTTSL